MNYLACLFVCCLHADCVVGWVDLCSFCCVDDVGVGLRFGDFGSGYLL